MQHTQWFLGIDGGGTKTEALLGAGKNLVWGKAGPSNPHAVGVAAAAKNVKAAILAAERQLGRKRPYPAVIGLAGMDTPKDVSTMRRALTKELRGIVAPGWKLVNDIIIALRSGTDAKHAAVIISGTGSNAYARGPKGIARAGGRGHRLADEGSGFAQGSVALHAVTKAADGRGPKTLLTKYVLEHFKIRNIDGLIPIVYEPAFGKPQIAALAPYVQFAAERGDAVAKNILLDAAKELALLATTIIQKSGLQHKVFPLVTVGGIFKCPIVLPAHFYKVVRKAAPKVQFVRPKLRPALGAWLMAGGR
ncbi:MAG: BadF/BadG/BcrA/BcrD ATPase family protein [Patescibacteria group bacterium]|mgnify:CR=1 FL=1